MKRLLTGVAIMLLAVGVAGCDSGTPSGPAPGEGGRPVTAADIDDGASSFRDTQTECPVCGGTPIKGEHYVDIPRGRIYFDKKECRDDFEQNQDEYLQKWQQRLMERETEQREGETGRDPTPSR